MQRGIGSEYRARFEPGRIAVEIGEHTTRFRDQYRQRRYVENVDVRLDHCLDIACCEQVLVIKITVAPDAVRRRDDLAQFLPAITLRK